VGGGGGLGVRTPLWFWQKKQNYFFSNNFVSYKPIFRLNQIPDVNDHDVYIPRQQSLSLNVFYCGTDSENRTRAISNYDSGFSMKFINIFTHWVTDLSF
jgi:hypothetical protein